MSVVDMLTRYGFLESTPAGIHVTPLGELGARVKAENELWTSLVLLDETLGRLSPISFIGVLSCVIAEESSRGGTTFIGVSASDETCKVSEQLATAGAALAADQADFGLEFPVNLVLEEAALPEYWASGASWVDMVGATSLQEGDICRKLRRVMDLLRQIPRLPQVPESVKKNAKRGLMLLNRFPVSDDVTYKVEDLDESEVEERDLGDEAFDGSEIEDEMNLSGVADQDAEYEEADEGDEEDEEEEEEQD